MLYKQELRRLRIWFEWMNARPIHEGYNFFELLNMNMKSKVKPAVKFSIFIFYEHHSDKTIHSKWLGKWTTDNVLVRMLLRNKTYRRNNSKIELTNVKIILEIQKQLEKRQ